MSQEQTDRSAATHSDVADDQLSAGSHGELPPSYGAAETTEHHEAAASPKKGVIQTLKEKLTGHKHHANDPAVGDHREDAAATADPDDHANVGCMDKLKSVVTKQKPGHGSPKDGNSPRVDGDERKEAAADEHGRGVAADTLHSKPKVHFQEDERGDGGVQQQDQGDGDNSFQESADDTSRGLTHPKEDHNPAHILHDHLHRDGSEIIKPNIHGIKSSDPSNVFVSRNDQDAPGDSSSDPSLHYQRDEREKHHDLSEEASPAAPAADSFLEDQTSAHEPTAAPTADSFPEDQTSAHEPPEAPAADPFPQDQTSAHESSAAPAAESFPEDQISDHDKFLNDLTPQALSAISHRRHQHESPENWPDREQQIQTPGDYSKQENPFPQNQPNQSDVDPITRDYPQQQTSVDPELDQQTQRSYADQDTRDLPQQQTSVNPELDQQNQRSYVDQNTRDLPQQQTSVNPELDQQNQRPYVDQNTRDYPQQQTSVDPELDQQNQRSYIDPKARDYPDHQTSVDTDPELDQKNQRSYVDPNTRDYPQQQTSVDTDPELDQQNQQYPVEDQRNSVENQQDQQIPSHYAHLQQDSSTEPSDDNSYQPRSTDRPEEEQPAQLSKSYRDDEDDPSARLEHQPNQVYPSHTAPPFQDSSKQPLDQPNQSQDAAPTSHYHQNDPSHDSNSFQYSDPNIEKQQQHPSINPPNNQPDQLNEYPSDSSKLGTDSASTAPAPAPDTAYQGESDTTNKASDTNGWPRPVHPSESRASSIDGGGKSKKEGFVSKMKDKFNLSSSTH